MCTRHPIPTSIRLTSPLSGSGSSPWPCHLPRTPSARTPCWTRRLRHTEQPIQGLVHGVGGREGRCIFGTKNNLPPGLRCRRIARVGTATSSQLPPLRIRYGNGLRSGREAVPDLCDQLQPILDG